MCISVSVSNRSKLFALVAERPRSQGARYEQSYALRGYAWLVFSLYLLLSGCSMTPSGNSILHQRAGRCTI